MKKGFIKSIASVLCLVLTAVVLVACGSSKKSESSAFIGVWDSVEAPGCFYTFNDDGNGVFDVTGTTLNFTYSVADGKLEIIWEGTEAPQVWKYEFSGDHLKMTDQETGQVVNYDKRK